jgi:hypothetical protein
MALDEPDPPAPSPPHPARARRESERRDTEGSGRRIIVYGASGNI